MHNIFHIAGYVLITVGVVYNLIAAIAVMRYSSPLSRLIASTKALAFGTVLVIGGAIVINGWSAMGVKSLLCLIFAVVTAPVEAHALLRSWYKSAATPLTTQNRRHHETI
ncbi:MAG: monovalent cation/H(+) antiporter subunit G [Elusimicrobia bacterium]|nr:monovalent cation/H(+) antiporter subunit G [Elusimicrobiota bacterium]